MESGIRKIKYKTYYGLLIMDSPQKAWHRYRHKIVSLIVGVVLDKLHLELPHFVFRLITNA